MKLHRDSTIGRYYFVHPGIRSATGMIVYVYGEKYHLNLLQIIDGFGKPTELNKSWLMCEASELVRALL